MNEPLLVWAKLTLRLALVLLAVGLLPVIAVGTLFAGVNPIVPVLLSVTVAPLGAFCLLVALILFLAAWVRGRPGPP
jgi:hypothetical protein